MMPDTEQQQRQQPQKQHQQQQKQQDLDFVEVQANDEIEVEAEAEIPYPGFYPVVLRCLHQRHPLRAWCLRAITWPWFERISMVVILANCITLGMYQPCVDEDCAQTRCRALSGFDHAVFAFFAWELCVKVVAMGVWGKLGYLGDSWNRLDGFIVVAGLLEYLPHTKDLSLTAIRTIRVLRPLRAINRIPSMRILVMLLLDTLPMLGNVLLLCFFVFFIFGIVGVQLWKGVLRNRCYLSLNGSYLHPGVNLTEFYKLNNSIDNLAGAKDFICAGHDSSGMQQCGQINPTVMWLDEGRYITCNRSAELNSDNLPTNTSCVNWNQYYTNCNTTVHNPYMNAINFDNIGFAWVAIFQVISLESWVDIMYYVQDAHSFWAWIYFVSLIVIGSFFMINLCLVVIATQFSETKKREVEKMLQERKRFKSSSTLTVSSEPASCYGQIVKLLLRQCKRLHKQLSRQYRRYRLARLHRREEQERLRRHLPLLLLQSACPPATAIAPAPKTALAPPRASPEFSDIDLANSPRRPRLLALRRASMVAQPGALAATSIQTGGSRRSSWNSSSAATNSWRRLTLGFDEAADFYCFASSGCGGGGGGAVGDGDAGEGSGKTKSATGAAVEVGFGEPRVQLPPPHQRRSPPEDGCQQAEAVEAKRTLAKFLWDRIRKAVKRLVKHRFFQRGILFAILINTFSMGIEYHDQPKQLTDIIEYSNIVFCVIFGLEMALKLTAEGPVLYISSGFNVFDAAIVILSIFELMQGHSSGLSVLRTFRLLRILKLVRFLPALRQQLFVMLKTMDNVATFFALLVLFIFIFSVLGMTLFGGKFCWHPDGSTCTCAERADPNGDCTCDRANFDTIMWSLVTVFQILTQEDWNTVLYNGMARTSPWAALYFIALMTFGNYVLFNLLVAILVEGFSSERKYYIMEKYRLQKKSTNSGRGSVKEEDRESSSSESDSSDSLHRCYKQQLQRQTKPKRLQSGDAAKATLVAGGALVPPIITHTAATPQPTPQGSPANEATVKGSGSGGDGSPIIGDQLGAAFGRAFHCSSSSIETIDRSLSTPDPTNQQAVARSDSQGGCSNTNSQSSGGTLAAFAHYLEWGEPCDCSLSWPGRGQHSHSSCNGHLSARAPVDLFGRNGRIFRPIADASTDTAATATAETSAAATAAASAACGGAVGGSPRSSHGSIGISVGGYRSHRTVTPQNSMGSCKDSMGHAWVKDADKKCQPEGRGAESRRRQICLAKLLPKPHGCFEDRQDYALYLLHPDNRFRLLCQTIISKKWFDYTVLFFIALNCITLAMERPSIPPDSIERQFLSVSNNIFTLIFTIEMTLKVLAKGLVIGEHTYLRSGWNLMDGALVAVSLIDAFVTLLMGSSNRIFGILRVFRLLRTLRPLRVISRAPGLKLVVQTLLSSLRPIGNIVLICCTFFIIFGILGVQLFKGKFYYCDGPDVKNVVNKTDCLADKRNEWKKHKYNFDNLGQALMALFVLSTKDGWVQIMYTGLDAVGEDMQPQENYNEFLLVYFISFLLLVGFFVLNMFVGVVVENFHKCRAGQEKEEKARRAAKRARRMEKKRKRIRETPYWAGYSRWRHTIHSFVDSKYFDLVIATIIGLNVITMAMEFYLMPKELDYALKTANYIFTSVFIIEAVSKVVALGARRYFKDRWNQLDGLIVVLSVSGIVLEEMEAKIIPINPTIIRVMRVLRIARVLKLLKMAKGIRALLDTVIQALPQVGNLGLLFFLLFFIFAALGVELFGRLECSLDNPCVGLNRHAHFENFGMAFLTLFRIATGDNWNGIMKDTLRTKCDSSDQCVKNCCVSHVIAPIYFVVFVLMAQFVLVNVVVAVLMKHLEESHKMMSDDDELEKEIRRELEEENRENQRQRDRREREKKEQQSRLAAASAGNKTLTVVNTVVVVDVNASSVDFAVATATDGALGAEATADRAADGDNDDNDEEELLREEAELEAAAARRRASMAASDAGVSLAGGASVSALRAPKPCPIAEQ